MAYIGRSPQIGNFVKLDDISTQFNGVLSTFNTTVSGVAYTVSNPYTTIFVGGGNVKQPGVDYNFNGTTIVFNSAPPSAWLGTTWCMVFGDVLASGTPSDGTITNAKLAEGTIQYTKLAATTKATILANSLLFGA
jgi:hypothetical protein